MYYKLTWLARTILLTSLLWMPYISKRIAVRAWTHELDLRPYSETF